MSGIRIVRPSEYWTIRNNMFQVYTGVWYSLSHFISYSDDNLKIQVLKSWTVLVVNKKLIVQHTSSLSDPDPKGLKSSSSEFADSSVSPSSSSSSSLEISKSRKRNWK